MRIACICSTKNEGDIIEAFVRLNGRICNSFFFIDDSTDHTREIIALLVKEGYDLNFLPQAKGGYNQPKPTRVYLSYVKERYNPDWIFLLDADEIIVAADNEKLYAEMQNTPLNTFLSAGWKTFVPTTLSYFDSTSPLSECFGIRQEKGEIFRKVSIPGQIADKIVTSTGNHNAKSINSSIIREQFASSYYLAHFPVRSAEQIIVKNLMAAHNLSIWVEDENGEGSHVFKIFHMLRNGKYNLTLETLANFALNYACDEQSQVSEFSGTLDLSDNWNLKTQLLYLNLARINVIERLDFEIERLSKKIKREKERHLWFKLKSMVKLLKKKL